MTLIDWYIVTKPSLLCSGRKSTSEKLSVDSIQNYPPQLTLKLSVVKLREGSHHGKNASVLSQTARTQNPAIL